MGCEHDLSEREVAVVEGLLKKCVNRLRNQGDIKQITQELNDAVVQEIHAALGAGEQEGEK